MPRSSTASNRHSSLPAASGAVLLASLVLGSACAGACIPEDLDASGAVDGADLGLLLANWGAAGARGPADLDGDGEVDAADLGLLLAAWGDVPAAACLSITSVSPTSGAAGTEVVLSGTFPNDDYLDYSLVAITGDGAVVPFEVTAVTADSLTARVGPYPPGTSSATLAITMGFGNLVPTSALPSGFDYASPAWVWAFTSDSVNSSVEFQFDRSSAPIDGTFFGTVSQTGLVVTVTGECAAGTDLGIWIHAQRDGADADSSFAAAALRLPSAKLQETLDGQFCAEALCNLISAIYSGHLPLAISGDCTIELGTDAFTLGSYLYRLDVTSGAFVIEGSPG
ncbi:MAG TPA: IPT/TIG domain-containing protein [Phycisphaerales bacterium]|nr:IPT/TIG domain-containing protein [Phycisphaerales bacterium]HMP37477.1 IPT/TIG domain-containing protein [Phycisphaerales bacterium]